MHKLAESFLSGIWNYKPGCLLEKTKRKDSIFLRELFQDEKNDRQREIEELHLVVNRLQYQQAFNSLETLSADLSSAKAALGAKLGESAHYANKPKFAFDIQATERCSKFFFRPPQLLYKSPIAVYSAELLESTCSNFNKYWSSIYCSPSREYGHVKPQWDRMELSRLLQYTTAASTPADRAYLDSPLTANEFYWALQHTSTGQMACFLNTTRLLEPYIGGGVWVPISKRENDQIPVACAGFTAL